MFLLFPFQALIYLTSNQILTKNRSYRKNVRKRVSIEMAATFGWERYVGSEGKAIGIDTFGASAPGETNIREYGFTVEKNRSSIQ
jgi:transketolase